MKANNKRKVFGDAVDLLMDEIEERDVPRGIQMIQIKNIQPFHDHPMEQSLIIFHKHFFKCPYHQHGRANTLKQAVRSIKGHDKYQLEVRKCV